MPSSRSSQRSTQLSLLNFICVKISQYMNAHSYLKLKSSVIEWHVVFFIWICIVLCNAANYFCFKTNTFQFKVDALIASGVKIEKIVVSPMTRTLQTAWGTFNGYNIPFQVIGWPLDITWYYSITRFKLNKLCKIHMIS